MPTPAPSPTSSDPAIDLEFVASVYGVSRETALATALRTQAVIAAWQLGRMGSDPEVLVRLLHAPPVCPVAEIADELERGSRAPTPMR